MRGLEMHNWMFQTTTRFFVISSLSGDDERSHPFSQIKPLLFFVHEDYQNYFYLIIGRIMNDHFFQKMFYSFLESQKFTYISAAFGSLAFELCDLAQAFWMCFHKLLAIVCRSFGLFLLTELVSLSCVQEAPLLFLGKRTFSPWWFRTLLTASI